MAHPEAVRRRARQLYMARVPLREVGARVRVGLGTVKRWCLEESWTELREKQAELERESAALAVAMARRARESADPQQAFAATHAAQLLRGAAPAAPLPPVDLVARALISVLASHPAVGPVVQRHRAEVLDLVARETERLQELYG